jgi:outer membrane protein assembly factor BamD
MVVLAVVTASGSRAQEPAPQFAQNTEKSDKVADTEPLAEKELKVGRYYVDKKRNYTGAINRFRTVVTQYPTSASSEEALSHLAESYLAIGINQEAQTAVAVLIRKFPDGHWSREARDKLSSAGFEPVEDETSWISRAFR